ncbi:MAG TPA: universal stress protein [Kofleriaceae bacterium]|nr:universal stress protein [Kofleriaceae bacterium]
MKRILVGTDFSPESHQALAHALKIARRLDATLLLAHAGTLVEPTAAALAPESAALIEYQKIIAEHEVENRTRLAELVDEVRAQGLRAEERLIDGFADTALRDAAEAFDVDLVVIGTHGRTGLKRLLLGSVAERVVRLCRRHVMVARAAGLDVPDPAHTYRRVLVPTDFEALAEQAFEIALQLVEPAGEIELFHAWNLPLTHAMVPGRASEAAIEPVRVSIEDGARAKARALIERHPETRARVSITIFNESPSRAISERAEQGGHDLIVMGGHGHRGLSRWILGSTAEATVRHAPCSVLVVHARPLGDDAGT